jgi:hypothetical protein
MRATFVDTNVLLDVVSNDATWVDWSLHHLDAAALQGPLIINDVVYAELSVRFEAIEAVDAMVRSFGLRMAPVPRPALFLAAKAYQKYRRSGGARTGVLPDFFIGAHAAVEGIALLSRDGRRFRTYFPKVHLVSP